ncbi:MAG: hypothetical protein Q4G42_00995 [Neisseria sp.]|nr:hypothetical protein [Neisseria sp.]
MYFVDRVAVTVRPTAAFLQWLNAHEAKGPDGFEFTLEQIRSNATVYLMPEAETPEETVAYVDEHYEKLFAAELASWSIDEIDWPQDRSLQAFWTFFEIEVHDLVLDVVDSELLNNPLPEND